VNYFWALALPNEGNDCFVCMSQLVFGVVFVLSAFSGERQSFRRFVAVVIALAGVFISAWQADTHAVKHKTAEHKEDILALVIYCVFAAVFQVLFKRLLGGAERRIAMIWLFLGAPSTCIPRVFHVYYTCAYRQEGAYGMMSEGPFHMRPPYTPPLSLSLSAPGLRAFHTLSVHIPSVSTYPPVWDCPYGTASPSYPLMAYNPRFYSLLGMMGLFTTTALWPGMLLVNALGV